MDRHALSYYRGFEDGGSRGHFHKVLTLDQQSGISWEEVLLRAPGTPRGWYEIAQLSSVDRVEFVREFWETHLPYRQRVPQALEAFFTRLDDIGIFLTQTNSGDPFVPEMVYSLGENGGFFHGYPPIDEKGLVELRVAFDESVLPRDYVLFLEIHDGFRKYTDTGVLVSSSLDEAHKRLIEVAQTRGIKSDRNVDPHELIPFYQSFDMPCYQCFWKDWYPETEMGNIYYSGLEGTASVVTTEEVWEDEMAFPTFLDWLMFYLEKVE